MGFDTEVGNVFMRHDGHVIRHLQKHQGINLENHYCDSDTGREFDVRDIPKVHWESGKDGKGVTDSHKIVIRRAIDAGWGPFAAPAPVVFTNASSVAPAEPTPRRRPKPA